MDSVEWDEYALVLLYLDYYDFWLFDQIDTHGGRSVSRLKTNANPLITEELRSWRGDAISLEGKQLPNVLSDPHRDVIDVRDDVTLRRRQSTDFTSTETQCLRVVGLWNEAKERYHLHITNLSANAFEASGIGLLYRDRWGVEGPFMAPKSRFRLDELDVTDPVVIEALILIAALSLVICRVIPDELREWGAQQAPVDVERSSRDRIPQHPGSLAMQRFGGVIFVCIILALGFDFPDLDDLLLFVARDPNPHRNRLRTEVKLGSFGAYLG